VAGTAGVSNSVTGFAYTFTAETAGEYTVEVRLVNTEMDANAQVDA
jgi:hypothetical protein